MCRFTLYEATTFLLSVLTDQMWSKEARSWTEMLRCHVCISVSDSNSCLKHFSIPKIALMSLAPNDGNLKRLGARCGWCLHTVFLHECPTHSHFDGLQVLPASILSPCMKSLCACLVWRSRPIRSERIHVMLITDCVHVPDNCTRAPSR